MKCFLSAALVVFLGCSLGMPQSNQAPSVQNADEHISRGVVFLRAHQAESALEEFKVAVQMNRNSSQALVWLGITYNQLGRFQDAISSLTEAIKLDPSLPAAHYNLALALARLGLRSNAIREFEEVVKLDPSAFDAQYNLAVLLEQEGNPSEAINHLQAARQARPEDAEIGLHLARDFFLADHSTEGLRVVRELSRESSSVSIAKSLGEMLVENGYFAEAVPLLERAQNESSASFETTSLLARAYIGSDSASKAIVLLKPYEDSDASGMAAYLLGLAYLSDNQPEPALRSFRIAAVRRPHDASAQFHVGWLLLKSSDEPDQSAGIEELQKATELDPQQSEYHAALGRWLLEHNRVGKGISVLQDSVVYAPRSAELYVLLSVAQALNQNAQAQASAEKAVALNPKIALAHDVLGFCYFRAGEYLQAAAEYKTASELNPQSGRFSYDTALALERANKPDDALPYAERATRTDPSVAINHYLLGKLYSRLEKKPESIRELETAVRLDPSLDYPYYLLARMYMRIGDTAKAQEWNKKLQELKAKQMTIHGMDAMSSERPEPPSLLPQKDGFQQPAEQ